MGSKKDYTELMSILDKLAASGVVRSEGDYFVVDSDFIREALCGALKSHVKSLSDDEVSKACLFIEGIIDGNRGNDDER